MSMNRFYNLPTDLQDKILTIVYKDRFKGCMNDINNSKLKKFCDLYDIIKNNEASFCIYNNIGSDCDLGWFNNIYEDKDIDDDREITYEANERDQRLSWKNYIKVIPEYTELKKNITYTFYPYLKISKNDLKYINQDIKYILNFGMFNLDSNIKSIILRKKAIDIYYKEQIDSNIDIATNILNGYTAIIKIFNQIEDREGYTALYRIWFGELLNWFENHSFLEGWDFNKKSVEPFFGS